MSTRTRWEAEFSGRMRSFEASVPTPGVGVSIKVRVTSGCFHRECSPRAFVLIDKRLAAELSDGPPAQVVEHESGPEVLAVVAGGLSLATSVINLVISILQARRDGIRQGDRPAEPLELIVRRFDEAETLREETTLRIGSSDRIDREHIERQLNAAVTRIVTADPPVDPSAPKS